MAAVFSGNAKRFAGLLDCITVGSVANNRVLVGQLKVSHKLDVEPGAVVKAVDILILHLQ